MLNMKTTVLKYALSCLAFVLLDICKADIRLPALLSDNMLLQQNTKVRLWGSADPGEQVTVKASWTADNIITTADHSGKWMLTLETPKASDKTYELLFNGKNEIRIRNILVGEVWLCSGQSNMDFPVAKSTGWRTGILDEEQHMKEADFPEIRLFHVRQTLSPKVPLEDCEGEWMICNPDNLKEFSAVAFFFGRKIYRQTKLPVGLIQTTWGGTHAESWTPMPVMQHNPLYTTLIEEQNKAEESYPQDSLIYQKALKDYEEARSKGQQLPKKPKEPLGIYHNKALATLWNGMVNPLVPYTIKGVIWYQGESNSVRYQDYQQVFSNMIQSWRTAWKQKDMPFYFVQIAPHYKQPPEIREAQLKTWQSVQHTGMVVITDVGDSTDIHPRNKQVPGERLANWALAKEYKISVAYSGPLYRKKKIQKDKVILSFDYVSKGFLSDGKAIKGFEIAGADQHYYPATATVQGTQLWVSSKQVKQPLYVRYAWGKYKPGNLYNAEGLPASPFRTDN
ncbi:hypothetical protein HMPREF0765_1816 [Sphingobacterium spiritivorum ATCC 33300]|uniref:Sialate O-acetylesterase domain-containing protein n=2 Tax=Sphingobacterium spiritivorum TaxID=258 RepID=C2FWW0_SPHSI|nr:hypothetical protein HMPREF0765_1816 [Sphingobacterium spiritivorum ATCC 33300]QQS94086.1 sialate O-acetylesterase [Sphingobacterium spiritivorum]